MVTIVLDYTKTLNEYEMYKPLLALAKNEYKCFYIKSENKVNIETTKNIVKFYSNDDYQLLFLHDITSVENKIEKEITKVENEVINKIIEELKYPIKIRHLFIDYNNSKSNALQTEFLKNTEIYLLPLNKQDTESEAKFVRNNYLKIFGFIDLLARKIIEDNDDNYIFKDIQIHKLEIELDENVIADTSKRYISNLEKEYNSIEGVSFNYIEYKKTFDVESKQIVLDEEKSQIINEKLNIKIPRITFFDRNYDLRRLTGYAEKLSKAYREKINSARKFYADQCNKARSEVNREYVDSKPTMVNRIEIENKLRETNNKISELKYKNIKEIIYDEDEQENFNVIKENYKAAIESLINNARITKFDVIASFILLIFYSSLIVAMLYYTSNLGITILKAELAVIATWLIASFGIILYERYQIRKKYKEFLRKTEELCNNVTESERNGISNIQTIRQLLVCRKENEYISNLLKENDRKRRNVEKLKKLLANHINFGYVISKDIVIDGKDDNVELDNSFKIDLYDEENLKSFSYMNYINKEKTKIAIRVKTAKVEEKNMINTYIKYITIK